MSDGRSIRVRPEEVKQHLAEGWVRGRIIKSRKPASAETIEKIKTALMGRKLSEKQKQAIRDGSISRGKVWVINGQQSMMVKPDAIPDGWRLGRFIKGENPKIVERQKLKERLLQEQKGICAFCLRGTLCPTCDFGFARSDREGGPRCSRCGGPEQRVMFLDHNHSHENCKGCDRCARGMVHNICNRSASLLERNPHLQNEFTRAYLAKGTVI